MAVASPSPSAHSLVRALCLVVLAVILASVVYVLWMWVANYPRISV
jgi:hypothetical protein